MYLLWHKAEDKIGVLLSVIEALWSHLLSLFKNYFII